MFGLYIKYFNGEVLMLNRGKMRRDFMIETSLFKEGEIELLENVSNHNNSFDIVIIVPTKINNEVLSDAFELINNEGFMLLYGGTQKGDLFLDSDVKIDPIRRDESSEKVNYKGKDFYITGAYGCSKVDFEKGIKLYKEHKSYFPPQKLVSKQIELSEFPELITKMFTGELDYPGKVIVRP